MKFLNKFKKIARFLLPHSEMTYRYKLYRVYENIRYRLMKNIDKEYSLTTEEIINRNRGDWTLELDENRVEEQFDILDKYIQFIASRLIKDFEIDSVLDVGCREGYLLEKLKMQGISRVKGFEIVPEWVKFCHSKGRNFVENVNLMEVNINDYNKFDFVFSRHTLEHVDQTNLFFRKLVKLCSLEGKLLIVFPLNESPNFKHPSKLPSLDYISKEFNFDGVECIYFGALKDFEYRGDPIDLVDQREDEEILMFLKKVAN